jgi:3',5'-cyclic-AMP phosphodiesterase
MPQTTDDHSDQDGIDRRGFLKCMAWAGTGLVWTMTGGILQSRAFGDEAASSAGDFTFVQISDSHIGFSRPPNKDVVGTLGQTISRINQLPVRPELLLHTGDLSHLSKPEEFDILAQSLRAAKAGDQFFVPGEHDVFSDDGQLFRERYGKNTLGNGWYSFDHKGVHFVALVNVMNLQAAGLGMIGDRQLAWLKDDLAARSSSTPIVVFAHVPLWSVYPKWGWGTQDSAAALAHLKRFGSVTVLNGHIHQILQKVEGNVTFHTAMSTAFPQPEPGKAESPGPLKNVAADQLTKMLGLTRVNYTSNPGSLAIVDQRLANGP